MIGSNDAHQRIYRSHGSDVLILRQFRYFQLTSMIALTFLLLGTSGCLFDNTIKGSIGGKGKGNQNPGNGNNDGDADSDTIPPSTPSIVIADPTTSSTTLTTSSTPDLLISGDTDAVRWCLIEQLDSDPSPSNPNSSDLCFSLLRPTTVTLSATGNRAVYLYTQDSSGNISASPALATIHYTTIGAFNISGIQGGSDSTDDAWLNGDSPYPTVTFGAASSATSYDLTVYDLDGSTVKCATVNVSSVTPYSFSSCALAEVTSYWVAVIAKKGVEARSATNSPYLFTRATLGSFSVSISQNVDDGAIIGQKWASGDSGSTSVTWAGEWYYGEREYAFLRFALPEALPTGTVVTTATLNTWGIDVDSWNPLVDALQVWVHDSADAPPITGGAPNLYPGDSGGTTLSKTSVIWKTGAGPGLTWNLGAWNQVEVKDLLQDLVGRHNGLNSGSHVQFWIAKKDLSFGERDVEIEDFDAGDIHRANLAVQYGLSAPGPFTISGVQGNTDSLSDEFLTSGTQPTVAWSPSLGASGYELAVYELDGTTLKCPLASTAHNVLSYSYLASNCTLTVDNSYLLKVWAKDSSGNSTLATNAAFQFRVGTGLAPVYPLNSAWNDYVKHNNGGTNRYDQPDESCDTSANLYSSCIHGGEVRKMALPITSCTGVTATDDLGVFNWICDSSSGNAVIYLGGLKEGKGLADLLTTTPSPAWKSNRLQAFQNATLVGQSLNFVWWSNPVWALPDNSSGADLSLDDTYYTSSGKGPIFVYDSDRTSNGYFLAAPKTAVVGLNHAVLRYAGSATKNCANNTFNPGSDEYCLLHSSAHFLWIEAQLRGDPPSGQTASLALALGGFHSRIRNTQISNFSYRGVLAQEAKNFFLEYVSLANMPNVSLYEAYCSYFIFHQIKEEFSEFGIYVPEKSIAVGILALNNSNGGPVINGDESVLSHVTTLAHPGSGIFSGSSSNLIFQLASFSNSNDFQFYFSNNNRIVYSAMNSMNDGSTGNIYSDHVRIGSLDVSGTYLGMVNVDDSINTSDTNGLASYGLGLDWWGFESFFRAWFPSLEVFPGGGGPCLSGNCQIWDWRLQATDDVLLNRSESGTAANTPFVDGGPCPPGVDGNVSTTDIAGRTFLLNAVEIFGDGWGNENGLCESNESCIYSPNIGIYQGEGDYTSKKCVFQNGAVSGVTMYAYPINGL